MQGVWKLAFLGLVCCILAGEAGSARAQTTLLNASSPTPFSYGNQTFTISGCLYNGVACSNGSNAEIVDTSNGRGGTTIVINGVSSAIYSGTGSYSLSFNLAVAPKTGTAGISKITNTLSGSDTSSAGNSAVFSGVTGNSPTAFTQIKSTIGTPTTSSPFTLEQYPNSGNFSIALGVTATSGQTLTLTNVALLFNPAPEPASIGLLATGLAGLATARRRAVRRSRQAVTPGV